MPAADKTLKILLQVQSDVEGLSKVNESFGRTATVVGEAGEASSLLAGALGGLVGGAVVAGVGALATAFAQIPQRLVEAIEETNKWNEAIINQGILVEQEIQKWSQLARTADSFKDVVKLSDAIAVDLQRASAETAKWRTTELGFWKTFFDIVARQFSTIPGFGATPFKSALEADTNESIAQHNELIKAEAENIQTAARNQAEWNRQQQEGAAAIPALQAKLAGQTAEYNRLGQVIVDVANKGALASDADRHEADQASLSRDRLGEQMLVTREHLDTLTKATEKDAQSTTSDTGAHKEFTAALREESLALQKIRSDLQNVEENPFLTLDEKNLAFANLIPQAIGQLTDQISQNKATLKGSALDPVQYQQVAAAIQRDEQELVRLNQQLRLTTFGGQFQSSLVQWVNQFGTLAQQTAGLITSTLGTAVSGLGNAITGLIFRTTTWGQAFAQVAQSIVGNIIQIGLQIIESEIAGFIIRQTLGKAALIGAATEATAYASMWSPAATLASIASYGAAAGIGAAAVTASLIAGQATAVGLAGVGGGFEQGGYTGELGGIAHKREYVIDAPTVSRAGGPAFFDQLRHSINSPGYERGGSVDGGAGSPTSRTVRPVINQALFLDMKEAQKWLRNRDGDKYIIDLVNSRGGHLRA